MVALTGSEADRALQRADRIDDRVCRLADRVAAFHAYDKPTYNLLQSAIIETNAVRHPYSYSKLLE